MLRKASLVTGDFCQQRLNFIMSPRNLPHERPGCGWKRGLNCVMSHASTMKRHASELLLGSKSLFPISKLGEKLTHTRQPVRYSITLNRPSFPPSCARWSHRSQTRRARLRTPRSACGELARNQAASAIAWAKILRYRNAMRQRASFTPLCKQRILQGMQARGMEIMAGYSA
jgi:hypothetical protein